AELPFFAAPALPLRPWLHAELRQLADELALPAVASLAIALMAQTRPGGAGARPHRHITTITARLPPPVALALPARRLATCPPPRPPARRASHPPRVSPAPPPTPRRPPTAAPPRPPTAPPTATPRPPRDPPPPQHPASPQAATSRPTRPPRRDPAPGPGDRG